MLTATYVRPDRVISTSVPEATAQHYQPVSEAQAVAQQFTRIYGPTVWNYKGTRTMPGLAGGGGLRGFFRRVFHKMGTGRPGAIPVAHGYSPRFNRQAQAAQRLLANIPSAQPPSPYMPVRIGAQRVAPNAAMAAAALSLRLTPGPQIVAVRGRANALEAFRRTGRYY